MLAAQDAYLQNVQATYRYYCFHVHNTNRKKEEWLWIPSKFHTFLCDKAQEFIEKPTDKAYEILILNTPPQHGKSTTITATLPSWFLMKNPDKKVIAVSYGDDLAQRFGKQNLEKVKEYGNIFGVKLDKKKANAQEFRIANHTGVMISAGYGSGLTGNPADLIVIDEDIFEDYSFYFFFLHPVCWNPVKEFLLKSSEETFHAGIVITVSNAA